MDFRDAISYIRNKKDISQLAISENIMTQSAYSKVENKNRDMSTALMTSLCRKLNAVPSDLDEILLKEQPYYQSVLDLAKVQTGLLPNKEALKIYPILNEYKFHHSYAYRAYIICKKNFHSNFPNDIPDITENEKNKIYQNIVNSTYHTYYDILNMAECVRYFSSQELIRVSKSILPLTFEDAHTPNRLKIFSWPILLINIADLIIDSNHFTETINILDNVDNLLKFNENYRFTILSQYARLKVTLFTTKDEKTISHAHSEIQFLINLLAYPFDNKILKDAMQYEFDLIKKNNKPLNEIITVLE
ncbi:helix-turn-helix transcriptional regulator [Vagococcus sp. BWB3-3]|uniref:Helix-turn-helix transcriptional regulator n=1 Tax=Vagococcus allomyrinae TaxID=2794353 RepID=A0A940PBI9_9ENTE|nr:helix-turn-helix transcriptional regulator [Vagococcus allomyrinae]MBP1044570.1 helix-turn-helix transcriptional regulator [Vagococcus allomyrinae]